MKLLVGCFIAALLSFAGEQARANHEVVVVTSGDSPMQFISSIELRKLYLGIPVVQEGRRYAAIRNQSASDLNEIFLQTLVSMSERSYEHRLLTLTLQSGRRRPVVISSLERVVEALQADPGLLTYMWREDFERTRGLKVVRTLWHRQ